MARQTNPKLLADFFNKIGQKATLHSHRAETNRAQTFGPGLVSSDEQWVSAPAPNPFLFCPNRP
jgi:hypothetical protein